MHRMMERLIDTNFSFLVLNQSFQIFIH